MLKTNKISLSDEISDFINDLNPVFANKMRLIFYRHEGTFQPWMVRRLQQKLLVTVESILEGN
jgi:hypothetical protein